MNIKSKSAFLTSLNVVSDKQYRSIFLFDIEVTTDEYQKLRRLNDNLMFFNVDSSNNLIVTYYHPNKVDREDAQQLISLLKDVTAKVEFSLAMLPNLHTNFTLQ